MMAHLLIAFFLKTPVFAHLSIIDRNFHSTEWNIQLRKSDYLPQFHIFSQHFRGNK